jgi:hypothetical protein
LKTRRTVSLDSSIKTCHYLQKQILQDTDDESILAWCGHHCDADALDCETTGILAPSPRYFARSAAIRRTSLGERWPFEITTKGLSIITPAYLITTRNGGQEWLYLVPLACKWGEIHCALILRSSGYGPGGSIRASGRIGFCTLGDGTMRTLPDLSDREGFLHPEFASEVAHHQPWEPAFLDPYQETGK